MMNNAEIVNINLPGSAVNRWLSDGGFPAVGSINSCERVLNTHEHIFLAGDTQTHIYQILEGVVSLYKVLSDGRRQIAAFCYPGDLIGLDHLQQFTQNAEALSTCRIRSIPVKAIDSLMISEPGFGQAMLSVLSMELADTRDQLLSLGRKSAMEKVATFLLSIARRNTREGRPVDSLFLPMTRGDIADYLGLTVETVSRNITKLRIANVIALEGKSRISVLDLNRLQALSEFEFNDE